LLDRKLHFHHPVGYLHSQSLKLLGLIHFITYRFYSSDSLKVLYITLLRSKLEYACIVCHTLTVADSNKLEYIQRNVINSCYNRFIHSNSFVIINQYCIIYILKRFIPGDNILMPYFLLTFSRTTLAVVLLWILLVSVYPLSKLETFPPLKSVMSQDFSLSARCITAANNICKSLYIFNKHNISLEDAFSFV
jgi:hypothetical protein